MLDYVIECNFTEAVDTLDANYCAHVKYELLLLLDGNVTMLINSKKYNIRNGALVLLTCKDLHLAINNTSCPYRRVTTHFDPKLAQLFNTSHTNLLACFNGHPANSGNILYLSSEQINEYVSYAKGIAPYWGSPHYGDDLSAISSLIELLIYINKIYLNTRAASPVQYTALISDVVTYIDSHLDEPLIIKEIAHRFSYSECYLSDLFSKQLCVPLKHYIISKKIALAKQLLENGCTVSQTCELSGFNDYCNFIHTFKRYTGHSPLKWKKQTYNDNNLKEAAHT